VHPIQRTQAMSDHVFWDKKIYCTKLARPLCVRALGSILGFCPITSEDFWPLTQQIGLASKYKVTLIGWKDIQKLLTKNYRVLIV